MEDVHHAGGIMGILGELDRWDIARTTSEKVRNFYKAVPGGVSTQVAFSQDRRFDDVDLDREKGVIRTAAHAYSKDGGLSVLFGNLAPRKRAVSTALRSYAAFASSAARGAVRIVPE